MNLFTKYARCELALDSVTCRGRAGRCRGQRQHKLGCQQLVAGPAIFLHSQGLELLAAEACSPLGWFHMEVQKQSTSPWWLEH